MKKNQPEKTPGDRKSLDSLEKGENSHLVSTLGTSKGPSGGQHCGGPWMPGQDEEFLLNLLMDSQGCWAAERLTTVARKKMNSRLQTGVVVRKHEGQLKEF